MDEIDVGMIAIDKALKIFSRVKDIPEVEWKENVDGSKEEVTKYDREINELIIESISEFYPSDLIIGEEISYIPMQRSNRVWLIDPIDGTISFSKRVPGYSTMMALVIDETPHIAIIHDVSEQETIIGIRGKGVWILDGAHSRKELKKLKNYNNALAWNPESKNSDLKHILVQEFDFEYALPIQSTGLRAKSIVQGRAQAMVSSKKSKIWDTAPANVILSELGVRYTDSQGERLIYSLADIVEGNRALNEKSSNSLGLSRIFPTGEVIKNPMHENGAYASINKKHDKFISIIREYRKSE